VNRERPAQLTEAQGRVIEKLLVDDAGSSEGLCATRRPPEKSS
jgi:hypothetical protein